MFQGNRIRVSQDLQRGAAEPAAGLYSFNMRLHPVKARTQAIAPKSTNSSWSLRSNVHNNLKRGKRSSVIRCYATTSSTPASLKVEGSQPKDPPVASWLGLGFLINGSDFTRKAVQKHGHVWKANVLGAAIYGLAGDCGLKAFYDENYIKRFPGMSTNLEQAAWVLKDDSGDPHYAIPPLDGVNWQPQEGAAADGKMNWKQRKAQFMAGIDTRDAVETYIRALDAGISDTIAKLAASDSEFALWDTINSLVLGGLSKAFFGYGIADYELGEAAMITNIQTGYTVFDDKLGGASQKQKDAFKANVRYLREALAQYRARPHKYPWAGLGRYLAAAEKLKMPDEDILMDMHQMICVGAYGGVTSAAGCMAYSLAKNPEVRAMVKSEIGANLGTATPTFASLKQLPYTFAVLKECLRRWPIVHIVRGFSVQEIVVEGKVIPKDSTVIAALHGTMHDPTVYKDPEKFDPLRFMPPRNEGADEVWTGYQVVFGAGESSSQHACAGKNTATLMLFVLLVRLAQNWQWELVSPWEHLVTNHFSPDPSNRLRMRRRR